MSRNLQQAVQAAKTSLPSQASRTPLVCARCLRAQAIQHQSRTYAWQDRSFVTGRQARQEPSTAPSSATPSQANVPQTHYDFFPQTFPHGPPPASPFTPDLKALRKEFLQLQAKAHPDLVGAGQKRHAEALSSRINEAYKVLQDPLKRAQYLLLQRGIDVEDESAKMSGGPLLMEVMEAREAVEEAASEEEVEALRGENNARIADSVQILENAFAKSDWDAAAHEAMRLRYWMNIAESIHGWDKEKGGGAIHH